MRNAIRDTVRDPLRTNAAKSIPLGPSFWSAYWDADCGVVATSDVSTWTSRVGGHVLAPVAAAPSVGVIGVRNAIAFVKASSEYLKCTTVGSIASGDDTAFTVAWHGSVDVTTSSDSLWAFSSSVDNTHYYRCRVASTAIELVPEARAGGGAVAGGTRLAVTDTQEYTFVFVRHGDTYDLYRDGSIVITGGALAMTSLGTCNHFVLGALVGVSAVTYSDQHVRRIAVASGNAITTTQVAAVDAAWRNR